jgi:hypothetical protein
MTRFHDTLDDLVEATDTELGRDASWHEISGLEDKLLLQWIREERFDDLIDHALEEFELSDGEAFCGSLGNALAQRGATLQFERLFLGLAKTREAAFRRVWSMAKDGHIGAMKESAMHLAQTQIALAGLYHCYWKTRNEAGMERVKSEMLRIQSATKPTRAP